MNKTIVGMRKFSNSGIGLRRSPRLNDESPSIQGLRRSPRLSCLGMTNYASKSKTAKNGLFPEREYMEFGRVQKNSKNLSGRIRKAKKSSTASSKSPRLGDHSDLFTDSGRVFRDLENSDEKLRKVANWSNGLRKSPTLNTPIAGIQCLKKYTRFENEGNAVRTHAENVLFPECVSILSNSMDSNGLERSSRLNTPITGIHCLRKCTRFEIDGCIDEHGENTYGENGLFPKCVPILSKSMASNELLESLSNSCDDLRKISNVSTEVSTSFANEGKMDMSVEKSSVSVINEISFGLEDSILGIGTSEELVVKGKHTLKNDGFDYVNINPTVSDFHKGNVGIGMKSKRSEGWTNEQEIALQKAYFAAKPTPQFWKKVSKLVPGKSAQNCFDKIHSLHITPIQPRLRSRFKKTDQKSPVSISKLLKPTEQKKRASGRQRKRHLTYKTIRHLLQRQCQVDQEDESDIFSVLEPAALSTPQHAFAKAGFDRNFHEKFSSGQKNSVSRLCNSSSQISLASPLVLKRIINKAVHEKYIAQLHRREAKRTAASFLAAKSSLRKNDNTRVCVPKVDAVKLAKSALVSDAEKAINQFRCKQAANATVNFFGYDTRDDVSVDSDDVEDENES